MRPWEFKGYIVMIKILLVHLNVLDFTRSSWEVFVVWFDVIDHASMWRVVRMLTSGML